MSGFICIERFLFDNMLSTKEIDNMLSMCFLAGVMIPGRPSHDSTPPEGITELILRIFRVNGALLAAGDRLVAALGLTSARWQLLGGIAAADHSLSVAELARQIGVTRQAVQRIANELETQGIIAFRPNPQHKRAQLIELTAQGSVLFERAMKVQRPWATDLARGITPERAAETCETLDALLVALGKVEAAAPTQMAGLGKPSA